MIYYATLTILFALGFYNMYTDNKRLVSWLLVAALFWLVLHDGLRWMVGTDWMNYYRFFNFALAVNPDDIYFEPGYVYLNQLVRIFTDDYTFFLLLHATIIYSLIGVTLHRYAIYPLLSLALMYALMLGYMGMNRQFISLALNIYSIRFIINRQPIPFFAFIVIGMTFHTTSILFSVAYFLNRPFKRYQYIIVLCLFLAVAISGVIRRLPLDMFYMFGSHVGDRIDEYNYKGEDAIPLIGQLIGIGKRLMWLVASLIYFNAFKKVRNFPLFFNIYFLSLCMYLTFNNTVLQSFVSRGILSLNLFEIMIVPMLLFIFKDNLTRKFVFVAVFVYCLVLMNKSFNTFEEMLGKDIFNPYRCVLFEQR